MKGQEADLLPADVKRCHGFLAAEAVARGADPTEETYRRFDRLVKCIESHKFVRLRKKGWFDVLLYQARLHAEHAHVTDYWHDWEAEREKHPNQQYPAFKEWRGAIDGYTFKIGDS